MGSLNTALPTPAYPTDCRRATAVLDSIAHVAGVPVAQLSVMHLSDETATVALEYAALYARLVGGRDRLPLCVDSTKSDLETYDDDGHRTRAAVPEIKMGRATVAVSWPPPMRLAADAAAANTAFKERCAGFGLPFPVQDADTVADNAEERAPPIFVAQYTPDSDRAERFYNGFGKHVLAAVAAPHDVLRAFAVGLHEWSIRRAAGIAPPGGRFGLYRLRYGNWSREADRNVRPLDSVFLPQVLKEDILRDVRAFFKEETKTWYAAHGIPYRRAYLLHGPPGTGKTSLVRALASDLRRNCCFLSMGNVSTTNEELSDALSQLPDRPLVVIEDVDAVFESAEKSKVSFSALLNVLDGVMSSEGALTVMTTNHPDRLDRAAIRAGRVDRTFHLGPAEDDVIVTCFRSFYKDADEATVQRFVRLVGEAESPEDARTIATLQELFIEMRSLSATKCVDETEAFLKRQTERKKVLEQAKAKYVANGSQDEGSDSEEDSEVDA